MGKKTSYTTGLTETHTVAKEKLGTIRDEGEKGYKYVKYNAGTGAIAGLAGHIVGYYLGSGHQTGNVTADVSDSPQVIGAGQLMTAMADATFGWMQIWGRSDPLAVDVVSGAAGNRMQLSTTTDGTAKVSAAVTDTPIGILVTTTPAAQRIILDCLK